jgi:hypothetical protein
MFGKENFLFTHLAPPRDPLSDREMFHNLSAFQRLDLSDPRLTRIMDLMLFDVLSETDLSHFATDLGWWSPSEFLNVVTVLRSYGDGTLRAEAFHAKTGIMGKTITDVTHLAASVSAAFRNGVHSLQPFMKLAEAPEAIQARESGLEWAVLSETDIEDIRFASKLFPMLHAAIELKEFPVPEGWTVPGIKQLLRALRDCGVSKFQDLFADKRFAFPEGPREGTCLAHIHGFAEYVADIVGEVPSPPSSVPRETEV